MSFLVSDTRAAGFGPLETVGTTQLHPLGTIVGTTSVLYGPGEAIYLQGVASTVAGDIVIYNGSYATTRAVARSKGPVAVAIGACVASNYGWYILTGLCPAMAGTIAAADSQAYVGATAGTGEDTVVTGDFISGAVWKTQDGTPAAGKAVLFVNRSKLTDSDNSA
jgi:hypothetical protein